MLFCAADPTAQVAKVALAFGTLVTPEITTSKLTNNEKISNREVARCSREVKVRSNLSHLSVVKPLPLRDYFKVECYPLTPKDNPVDRKGLLLELFS